MEPGQPCRLHLSDSRGGPLTASAHDTAPAIAVRGVVVATRPHAEDSGRLLLYVRCTHIDTSPELTRLRRRAAAPSWSGVAFGARGSGTVHRSSELRLAATELQSSEGYHYRYDGWYDASMVAAVGGRPPSCSPPSLPDSVRSESEGGGGVKAEEEGEGEACAPPRPAAAAGGGAGSGLRPVPEEWVSAMERDTGVCEVVYLCYAFRPWFPSPYTALGYLALPEDDVCHSVYLCHRCLSPFFTREQYYVHLQGRYCALRSPPGHVIYHDAEAGHKAFVVDGAKHLHYCRCLSLVGKHFIESKLLTNDVDLYEYVVVTVPRRRLPYCAGSGVSAADFADAASCFDGEDWDGDAVAGYFSRLKHCPNHTLSCIVTLPIFQRTRIATFMLDLAYWMLGQRQRLCGGAACCGRDGGAISRPLSPHGQALLLAYWRRALLRGLSGVAPRRRASRLPPPELSFTLPELQRLTGLPLHRSDLELLLLHSEFAFYTVTASAEGNVSAEDKAVVRRQRQDGAATAAAGSCPPRFTVTLVLEEAALRAVERAEEEERRAHAKAARGAFITFEKRWLARDGRGAHVYHHALFHY